LIRGMVGRERRRRLIGLGLAAALVAWPAVAPRADEAQSYGDHARATIAGLLNGRDFAPEDGCGRGATCAKLIRALRLGDFAVVAPAEQSDRPDLPDYLHLRKRCPGLDPLRVTLAHRLYAATRDFAVWRLQVSGPGRRGSEVLVFRGEHYVAVGARGFPPPDAPHTALIPGSYVALSPRGCRLLATARAEDGDWLAKHNAIGENDHASELLQLGGSYFVLNIAPIAGPQQPKASWWYTLELWDLGPQADAARRHDEHVYSFGYKPGAPDAQRRIASHGAGG
jgi:hypothetical protein